MSSPCMFWNDVVRLLEAETPSFVIDAWVRPLVAEANGDQIRLLCPSALHRDRIRDRFLRRIRKLVEAETGKSVEIELDVAASTPAEPISTAPAKQTSMDPVSTASAERATSATERQPRTRTVRKPEQHNLPYTFENFVVGACNRLAREASLAVAQGTQQTVNPLYLSSAPGLGKTHLARAIAEARARTDGRVIYTSSESFTNQFTGAIRARKMDQFKKRFRHGCDVLLVEDVQFFGGKKATQFELFQTLSHLVDVGARVVLTADRLPGEIAGLDERVRSHMAAGLVATLEAPDALVRREILRSKAASGGVRLPNDCLDLLVDVVRGSVRDLEGTLVQLVTTSSLLKRPIDLELTEQALAKVSTLRATKQDLAVYLCRRYTKQPASAIARAFARSHPSVGNAEKVVERRMLENAPFRYRVEAISARLDELERRPASP